MLVRAIPRIIHGSCQLGADGMVVAQAIMANAGFYFFLAWMLLAFTRGRDGVLFVGDRLLGKEGIFTTDFDSFCKNLVKAAKQYCSIHGKSALSHVEGYHTGLSGLTFLLTLRLKKNRNKLVRAASAGSALFDRILRRKGRKDYARMSMEDFLYVARLIAPLVLRTQTRRCKTYQRTYFSKDVCLGRYHQMEKMRCLENVVTSVLGANVMRHDDALHQWYVRRQSKKNINDDEAVINGGAVSTTKSMKQYVSALEAAFPQNTVNWATAFVNLCELRQAINKFGKNRILQIVEKIEKPSLDSRKLRNALKLKRAQLNQKPYDETKGKCFAVRLCNVAVKMQPDRSRRTRRSAEVFSHKFLVRFAKAGLSPKCTLEGIPEWCALKNVLVLVRSRCRELFDQLSHADLVEQMRARGLRTRTRAGRKFKRAELKYRLQSSSVTPSVELWRRRKRKAKNWYDLAQEMKNCGGNPRPTVNGKRVRLSRSQLTRWIASHRKVCHNSREAGRKLKKAEFECKSQSLSLMPSVEVRRRRKRKAENWYDLAQEMKNRGGNARPTVGSKRVRISQSELTQWMACHKKGCHTSREMGSFGVLSVT